MLGDFHWGIVGWFGLIAGLTACSKSKPGEEVYCETECRRSAECLGATGSGCVGRCLDDNFTRNIRGEVLVRFAGCLDQLSCPEYRAEDTRVECFDEAFESASPSRACRRYCERDTQKAFECGYRYSVETCLKGNCGVADAMLSDAAECSDHESCEEWETCLDRTFVFE